jgi:hypothetical protein
MVLLLKWPNEKPTWTWTILGHTKSLDESAPFRNAVNCSVKQPVFGIQINVELSRFLNEHLCYF